MRGSLRGQTGNESRPTIGRHLSDRQPMSIILVRHGETALNAARTLQPADTPLSERGLLQAAAVAKRLADLGISAILSSDLPRTMQTAQVLSELTGVPVVATELLRERDFGDLRGQPYDSLGFNPLTMAEAPPGGESAEDFRLRVEKAFALAVQMRASLGGNLAVVTHGLVVRAILAGHVQLPDGNELPLRIGNTSITICAADAPHAVDVLDCVRHLDEAIAHDAKSLSGG